MDQLSGFCVCQICGRGLVMEAAVNDGWLVSPYRIDENILVVRCPQHISEWSLRQSMEGRTKEWRKKAKQGKERNEVRINPFSEPFPYGGNHGPNDITNRGSGDHHASNG